MPLVALGILVIGLVGGALILHALEIVEIPLLAKKDDAPKAPDRTGMVAIPRAARTIPAYGQVQTKDIVDPQTGVPAVHWLPEAQATPEMLRSLKDIIGRVLRYEKPPGYVFTEADFYPKGTKPGPTAGIPPGKRAMRLKASDVPGLHGLRQGDRFDLVMTQAVEVEEEPLRSTPSPEGSIDVEGPYAKMHEADNTPVIAGRKRVKRQHAEVKTIVNNGIVVQPVMQRQEIGSNVSLLRGSSLTATPIEEIIIAVEPQEVADLNLALALEAKLQVAMRSGQVGQECDESCIPNIEVLVEEEETTHENGTTTIGRTKVVETIKGDEKSVIAVPKKSKENREAAE